MSPSLATGGLPGDPQVGTPEWEQLRQRHAEVVARGARLRQLEARLPEEILENDHLENDLAMRLRLKSATRKRRRPAEKRAKPGETKAQVVAVLPGKLAEIVEKTGLTKSQVQGSLEAMRVKGEAAHDHERPATWYLVQQGLPWQEAA